MKVLVVGEKCSDIFVYGEVERLSPEAPIPVLIPKNVVVNDGMGKNVVNNLLSITQNESYEIGFIHQDRMISKTRFVEEKSNHPFLRVDEGEFEVDRFEMTEEIKNEILESDAVIVSDYNKGFLLEEDLIEIASISKFSVLDTKKKLSKKVINSFDFVKMNEYEYMNNYTKDAKLLKKLIITLGSKGANHNGILYPTDSPKETVDVSGAGDTFTASFTKKYLETKDIRTSIIYANRMASLVVSKRGVTTPY